MLFILCECMYYIPACTLLLPCENSDHSHAFHLCSFTMHMQRALPYMPLQPALRQREFSGRRKPELCRCKYTKISDNWKEIKQVPHHGFAFLVPRLAERPGTTHIMPLVLKLWLDSKAMAGNS